MAKAKKHQPVEHSIWGDTPKREPPNWYWEIASPRDIERIGPEEHKRRLEALSRERAEWAAQDAAYNALSADLQRRGVPPPSLEEVLRHAGISHTEWVLTHEAARLRAESDAAMTESERKREALVNLTNISLDMAEWAKGKRDRQQAGNEAQRACDDGFLEEASHRHCAGEAWKEIAPDYSISESRLRHLVRKAGQPTRGRR